MTPNTPFLPPAATLQTPLRPSATAGASLSSHNYAFLQRYIHAGSGIVLEEDKQYLLESRLLPIIKQHSIGSLDELSVRLSEYDSAPLGKQVLEAMTTNETLFFRDPAVFEALRQQVLPALFDRIQGTRKLRIWSAAAASGQEAYSLAMMLLDMGKSRIDFEILGTDLSNQVLNRAREGKYVQFEVNRGMPAPMLLRYFTRSGLAWQIKDEVRQLVRFEQLDLRRDFRSLGTFDLVLCRNVLIYFDLQTKKEILGAIRGRLHPGSVLVLGCSETVINVHDGFERTVVNQSTFYTV
jgi:chemotaxis protein methyltransferase CheR